MAGVGFALRRLAERGDLLGVVQAYAHSAAASTGPWLYTILCLATLTVWSLPVVGSEGVTLFRAIVTYNFAFSLVFSGGVVRVVTRCLADQIYERRADQAPGMLMGGLFVLCLIQMPIAVSFYIFVVDLSPPLVVQGLINYFLVTGLWLAGVFLTALRVYTAISLSFVFGLGAALGLALVGGQWAGVEGMLIGFNAGLALVLFLLVARTFAEYPYPAVHMLGFLRTFKPYWSLALAGFFYNVAIWVDKWVMWLAPEREKLPSGFIHNGTYDTAMFLAYLSIVPSMAVFLLHLETRFYEKYLRFYREIESHATYERIEEDHGTLIGELAGGLRNLIVIQATISLLCIILAPRILEALDVSYLQLGIFRFGVIGAFFHVLLLCLTIVLSYFELRAQVLFLTLFFLATNAIFTWYSLQQGFAYYGYGYFASALLSFLIGAMVTFRELGRIPYHTFITQPPTARAAPEDEPAPAERADAGAR
ncbi:MAG TPA: exopolysaccharide Pel transporter PelG [Alphaproteobacteria bacterium]|jgi:uncharacterized membrane protein